MADHDLRLTPENLDAAVELMGRSGRRAILPMHGESMLPTLRSGQWVAVDLSPERIERGDLVLYRQQGYLVVHRLLGTTTGDDGAPALRTRGDGLSGFDPPLDRARVRGRVVAIRDEDRWWDLEGGAARAYAVAIAVHDLCWATAGAAGARLDRLLQRLGFPAAIQTGTGECDRRLLRLVHRMLFGLLHRKAATPPGESTPMRRSAARPSDR
jgi:hypothetical protein